MASATPTANQTTQPPQPSLPSSPPNKRDLKSWWKGFKLAKHQEPQETRAPGIFGIPLRQSITYANVAISLIDENGQSYIYGYVPIVVAKCGVFLKEKATGVEGIFRLSGSEKRIKELKTLFDSPDRYGKGLVWDGYTVHDAATVLRRYLNDLPEPVVPLDLYEKFRDPLRGATKQAVGDTEGPQFVENFDEKGAIAKYQRLITELPPLNRQLLLYILDLLAVFAAKSDENRMNSQNLAAIFQPGMLSHPNHAMAPEEYRLNQCVIIFLIENQDHFLIGMQGTAADEKTVKEVQSGTPKAPLTPIQSVASGVNRSVSNASAGADSVRREGQVRRNRSVSSKHSKKDGSSTPNSPANAATPTTGGLGRSNTVPSKKSPALVGGKFKRNDGSNSPAGVEPLTPARIVEEVQTPVTQSSPSQGLGVVPAVAVDDPPKAPEKSLENSTDVPASSKEKGLQGLFHRTPTDGSGDKRQPNKLRKKRIPGTMNMSAHSSTVSLGQSHSAAATPSNETSNPIEAVPPISQAFASTNNAPTSTPATTATESTQAASQGGAATEAATPAVTAAPIAETVQEPNAASAVPEAATETNLPNQSSNDAPNPEQTAVDNASEQNTEKEKKKRWRLSRAKKDDATSSPPGLIPSVIGSNENADVSTTSFASSTNKPRKSFQAEGSEAAHTENEDASEGGRSREDSKGPIGWIKNKYREAKENSEQKRAKSPDSSSGGFLSRGKSVDIKRDAPSDEAAKPEALPDEPGAESSNQEVAAPAPALGTTQEGPQVDALLEKPVESTTEPALSTSTETPTKALDTVQETTTETVPVVEHAATDAEAPTPADPAAPKQD